MSKSLQELQAEFGDSMRAIRAVTDPAAEDRRIEDTFREMFGDDLPDFLKSREHEVGKKK